MKCIRALLVVAVAAIMAACSGYDAKKCDELAEKVANNEKLTQSDYAAMIEQLEAMDEEYNKIEKSVGDDAEEQAKLLSDKKFSDMLAHTMVFSYVLSFSDDLDASNAEAWDKLQRKFEARDN